jgi:hypothetical protein
VGGVVTFVFRVLNWIFSKKYLFKLGNILETKLLPEIHWEDACESAARNVA